MLPCAEWRAFVVFVTIHPEVAKKSTAQVWAIEGCNAPWKMEDWKFMCNKGRESQVWCLGAMGEDTLVVFDCHFALSSLPNHPISHDFVIFHQAQPQAGTNLGALPLQLPMGLQTWSCSELKGSTSQTPSSKHQRLFIPKLIFHNHVPKKKICLAVRMDAGIADIGRWCQL